MKQLRSSLTRGLFALAVAGVGLAATPGTAHADFLDFTVVEGEVPDTPDHTIVVDKVNGAYAEVINLGAGGNFEASLYVNFSQYLANEGTDSVGSFLQAGTLGIDLFYGMYALVTSEGTFTGSGTVADPFLFEPTSASATLHIDENQNTTFTLGVPGAPVGTGNTGDDLLVMSANNIDQGASFGLLVSSSPDPDDQGGFYNLVFIDPVVEAFGQLYWPDLPLLGLRAINDGDFDDATLGPGDNTLSGDVSLVFQAPEPASLSLFGLGLLGSALAVRRRRAAQVTN
jgi:hypothetical protein